jgi:putative SOS response-associated peptidase YedK
MCNLYAMTSNQKAIRKIAKVLDDLTGNLQPLLEIYQNAMAPVVRNGEDDLFGFLTTGANREVGVIHLKAVPVILVQPEDMERWMTPPTAEALKLQRPLPDGLLCRVQASSG